MDALASIVLGVVLLALSALSAHGWRDIGPLRLEPGLVSFNGSLSPEERPFPCPSSPPA